MAPAIGKIIYNMEIFKFILCICDTGFGLVVRFVTFNLHFLLYLSVMSVLVPSNCKFSCYPLLTTPDDVYIYIYIYIYSYMLGVAARPPES
jgi:hypothetical protein